MKTKELIYKPLALQIKDIDENKYRIKAVFSTPDIDRHGEIVDQKGWKLDEYRTNPVLMAFHDHHQPVIGAVPEIGVIADTLEGVVEFAVKENPLAEVMWNLYKAKYQRAFSAGFANDLYEYDQESDQIILRENTLYEISAVNVPACARALAKQKGIDTAPLEKALEVIEARRQFFNLSDNSIEMLSQSIAAKLRADISEKPTEKVETPQRKGGRTYSISEINKQIRDLLKTKHELKQ